MPPEPSDVSAKAPPPVLDARNLVKRFGPVTALDGVSFDIVSGQSIVILGPSGSGKSTLLRCLNYLERPDSGELLYRGEPVRTGERALDAHRANVGMVFQQFNLFGHLSVWENIALAPRVAGGLTRDASRSRALEYLAKVGLSDKADAAPSQLSGGQQQRVAIARALAREPFVLLFDEPTSSLDPELKGEVQAVIRSLAYQGRTQVIVTHELDFARAVARWVVVMDAGRIVEEGPAKQVFESPREERTRRFLNP